MAAKQSKPSDYALIGYIVLEAELETISPLRIGSGRSDRADVEVIRRADGQPYIPASSLVGALAHRFYMEVDLDRKTNLSRKEEGQQAKAQYLKQAADIFWGTEMSGEEEDTSWQSHFRVPNMDLTPPGNGKATTVRDGVKIDPVTGTAEENKKFDYEILEPGHTFTLKAELTLRQGFAGELDHLKEILAHVKHCLEENFRIGARTTRGFGQVACKGMKIRHFDFAVVEDRKDWFAYTASDQILLSSNLELSVLPPLKPKSHFSLHATFALQGPLLIGSAPGPNDDANRVQLKSGGKPTISGTSLAGAIRHRAYKILQTCGMEEGEAYRYIGALFGRVDTDGPDKKVSKSKVSIYESEIKGAVNLEQPRIRIDRFTGGASRGGLFTDQPVTSKEADAVALRLDIESPGPTEIALLLHVLKDLWTADLAIGGGKNIGRGRLKGTWATLNFHPGEITLTAEGEGIALTGDEMGLLALEASEKAFSALFTTKSDT